MRNGSDEAAESKQQAASVTAQLWRAVRWPLLVLVLALGAWWAIISSETPRPDAPLPSGYFNEFVEPSLDRARNANADAAERAVERVHLLFEGYREGMPGFADELTGMRARFRILRQMPADWWSGNEDVHAFVQDMFEAHLFSAEEFESDVEEILVTLREELQANERRLLSEVKHPLAEAGLSVASFPGLAQYSDRVSSTLTEFGAKRGQDSVYSGIATLVAAETVSLASYALVTRVLATVSTTAATSAASSGSMTTATTTGGTVGSVGGPVGIAVGLGVGLAVGVAVDWWLTDRFKGRLANDLGLYLDDLEDGLLESCWQGMGPICEGLALKETLGDFATDLSTVQYAAMRDAFGVQ